MITELPVVPPPLPPDWEPTTTMIVEGFPGGASGKEPTYQCRRHKRRRFDPWVGKILWRRAWQLTPEFLPGESHGQRSLVGHRVAKSRTWLKQLSTHTGAWPGPSHNFEKALCPHSNISSPLPTSTIFEGDPSPCLECLMLNSVHHTRNFHGMI